MSQALGAGAERATTIRMLILEYVDTNGTRCHGGLTKLA